MMNHKRFKTAAGTQKPFKNQNVCENMADVLYLATRQRIIRTISVLLPRRETYRTGTAIFVSRAQFILHLTIFPTIISNANIALWAHCVFNTVCSPPAVC
jgi:hypothetical protein